MINSLLERYDLTLKHPHFLWLLLLIPVLYGLHQYIRRGRRSVWRITTTAPVRHLPLSRKVRLRPLLNLLRIGALALLIIALARPQRINVNENIESEGIDIVLSMDVSGSMSADDLKPNRLVAAINTATNFINERPGDRIGLVIFGEQSMTMCPVTIDHEVLLHQLENLDLGLGGATAIGNGLASAVDKLRDAKGKSKTVILLTDGENNAGAISPLMALDIAKTFNVRVYTIGVGTDKGVANVRRELPNGQVIMEQQPVKIDEPLLKKMAAETGGKYYRATDNESLKNIYEDINRLEKTKVEISSFKKYSEAFFPFAIAALCCITAELLLRYLYFRSLP